MASVKKVIPNRDKVLELYASGKSTKEVSSETGISLHHVRCVIKDNGSMRTFEQGIKLAGPKLSFMRKGKKLGPFTESHKRNISKARMKNGLGYSLKPNGYIESTKGPTKGKSVHRLAMELKLHRTLTRNEVVHHIDRDKANNSIENLQVMTRSAHTSLHRREGK